MQNIGHKLFCMYSRVQKENCPALVVPVFMVAVASKEKGQSFFHDPLYSLLSVQALQRSGRQILVNLLKLQHRSLLVFKTCQTIAFHIKELFTSYTNSVMVVYWRGSSQCCGVTSKELGSAVVQDWSDSFGDKLSRSILHLKQSGVLVVYQRLWETLDRVVRI